MNILQAMADPLLFGSWFKRRDTWGAWKVLLACLFGLPLTAAEMLVYETATGRTERLPDGFSEAWLVCGRRAGKSIILALISVYLSCFRSYVEHLAPGERGTILVLATDRRQARVIFRYARGMLRNVPMLAKLIERETEESIQLSNRVTIEVSTASFRAVRGHTLVAGLCDEAAFWRSDESANPDTEILDALRPAMATIPNSMLLCASSPYAKRGALFDAFKRYHGRAGAPILVWKAATRVMNPTVPQRVIDEAMERDSASATAEYLAEFRTDIAAFIDRAVIESCIVPWRYELLPATDVKYRAFVDPSGGSSDSMTIAVAHRTGDVAVLDCVREVKPPFSPENVVAEFAALLRTYRISSVVGDRYAGEWVREPFRNKGIAYALSELPKSDLYRDVLPLLNSGKVELLDMPRLTGQFCGLERRTSRAGRDSIDHGPNAHDDICNSVSGALLLVKSAGPTCTVRPLKL